MAIEDNDLFASFFPDPKKLPGAKDTPTFLSHYTSLEGFLSIIESHTIRASNISFLNDKEEMEYGLNVAKDVIKEIEKATTQTEWPRNPWSRDIPDVYACCFCEQPDMLSQWRGYGASSQSVSIQFSGPELYMLARTYEFDLERVIYGRKRAMELLRERLKFEEGDTVLARILFETKLIDAEEMRYTHAINLAPRFKNEAFSEEHEWRIIAKQQVVKDVKYRVRDNVIMPYVDLSNTGTGLPIERITVGPGKETSLTVKSIEKLLSNSILYKDVKVIPSKIPFRS